MDKAQSDDVVVDSQGVHYNQQGLKICGALNKYKKPCKRLGKCPFHSSDSPKAKATSGVIRREKKPTNRSPYKKAWSLQEHVLFLKGLQIYGKGKWKPIAQLVSTRTPSQIQAHANTYFKRRRQTTTKNRSIHDISLEQLEYIESQIFPDNNITTSTPPSTKSQIPGTQQPIVLPKQTPHPSITSPSKPMFSPPTIKQEKKQAPLPPPIPTPAQQPSSVPPFQPEINFNHDCQLSHLVLPISHTPAPENLDDGLISFDQLKLDPMDHVPLPSSDGFLAEEMTTSQGSPFGGDAWYGGEGWDVVAGLFSV